MKLINDIYIIGLDHGYGNMKTANHIFPTGLLAFDQLPTFTDNLLIWQSRYYLIGTGHNVKYTVSSKFLPSKEGKTFHERIKRSVVSDFTHLHLLEKSGTMNAENVCLTAGEED